MAVAIEEAVGVVVTVKVGQAGVGNTIVVTVTGGGQCVEVPCVRVEVDELLL